MSTRYAWISEPVHELSKAEEIYDDVKNNIFNNQDDTQLQLVNFGPQHMGRYLLYERAVK